jgi:hypothetical protein
MGLAERRAAKNFETTQFPALKKEIDEAAKFAVPVEVAWDTLAVADYAHLYDEAWPKVYFRPLIEALKAITVDDMGRDALKVALKKIVILNKGEVHYGDRMATFEAGTLTLDHEPCTNVDDLQSRIDGIRALLEKSL